MNKKILFPLLLLGFIITFNTIVFGQQAVIDIPLIAVNGSYSQVLTVGGDPTATNGIDAALGENKLPPPPSPGTFDIRFDLSPYGTAAGTLKDYRYYPGGSFTDTIQHTLIWQLATGTNSLVINYGLPSGATMNIQDGFGGLIFNSGTLSATGSYRIPAPLYNQTIVTMTYLNIPVNQPLFSITPSALSFGPINVSNNSSKTITVSNVGNRPLNISGVVSSDAQFTFAPNTFPAVIAAGSNQVFNVSFTPTEIGTQSETLTILHDAPGSPTVLPLSGTGYKQGGLLRFAQVTRDLLDGTENNQDTVVLENYTGQPMKSLKFNLVMGKSNGKLILRSIGRGSAIPAPQFHFSYEIYPGPTLPDGSSRDILKVTIAGNGTNAIQPAFGAQEILKFGYSVVNINPPDQTTTNALENVIGLTETPVINATIYAGPDEILNIWNGFAGDIFGDVNLDNNVNILDILLMIDHVLDRVTLTGFAFTIGDMAPWIFGQSFPTPDDLINELDLSVLRYTVLTGFYPSYTPVYKTEARPFEISHNTLSKLTPGMNANLTFYLSKNGISVRIESIKKIKGVQIELEGMSGSIIPGGTKMTSVFEHALYFPFDDLLRILAYDPEALAIDAGEYILAELPFTLNNPEDIIIEKAFLVDENNERMDKVEVEIAYEEYSTPPLDYLLEQNFPNPFNPRTTINFNIPQITSPLPGGARGGFVTLKVYDILGNEVATLVNENKPAGYYQVKFDASEFASGVYMYKLSAENFIAVKKMILIK